MRCEVIGINDSGEAVAEFGCGWGRRYGGVKVGACGWLRGDVVCVEVRGVAELIKAVAGLLNENPDSQ